ncbi:uncharacterized protein Bfra_009666 [Botrytis fragariae]|uniref:Uncharacterized protein n=1 Tax=Botrytis fragariae TaxID=1964551 RepID=A0A8H6AMX6_9HELO|nr:uncharacterized protein Bfra_009666 [Botrytis fragariae]KAF5870283.1 hypothetical protein Bfra_009666 [Botrytis fragariae]
MFTIPSIFPNVTRIRFSSGAEIIYTTNSWAEKLENFFHLAICLAVLKLVSMALFAAKRRSERKLQEENARITRMVLLIQTEMRDRRQAGVKIEGQSLLDRKRQKELWRTVIVEERVKLISNNDLKRRSRAFFPDY